jgi:hypothetical protein
MAKRIRHMGMTPAKEEHDRWHKETAELTPKRHAAMLKKLGITPEQDAEWHRTHKTLRERRTEDKKSINPFAVGGAFLDWCTKHGWLVRQGRQYFATKEGVRELRQRFEIKL